jgi:drug/metabolite transporter (DMT)-like permease
MSDKSSTFTSPMAGLVLGIIAVSTASLFIRFAQQDVSSLVIAAYRMGLSALVIIPFSLYRNWPEFRSLSKRQISLILLSGLFLCFHFATWISSLEYTTVASSVVLVTTSPLWVAILSPLVLKERIRPQVAIGLAVALAGSTIVGLSNSCTISEIGVTCPPLSQFIQGRAFIGNLLALAGALLAAGYLLVGRQLRAKMSLSIYTSLVYGTAAVGLLALVAISGEKLVGYPVMDYWWFVCLAFVPQLLGHTSFNWALKYLPASIVSIALLGEPVGSTILALIFLKEIPSAVEIAGGILILTGIYLSTRGKTA